MEHENRIVHAALGTLVCLQVVMLASMMTKTPPYPPLTIPLFAMGPFLASSISVAVAALMLRPASSRTGAVLSIVAALLALISFGPQKWLDSAISEIWPAVFMGQIAAAVIFWSAFQGLRKRRLS